MEKKGKKENKMADSKSLHNYTLSPGWNNSEVKILKKALKKYGIGKWKKIQKSGCLPSKTISQMNLQTQRLLGQQSLAEFMGLHVRIKNVWLDNQKKIGPEIQRKNNFIINTGDNLTADEKRERLENNKKKYGLTKAEINAIKIPTAVNKKKEVILMLDQIQNPKSNFSVVEKLHHLDVLKQALENKLRKIQRKKMKEKFGNIKQQIIIERVNDEENEEFQFVQIEKV